MAKAKKAKKPAPRKKSGRFLLRLLVVVVVLGLTTLVGLRLFSPVFGPPLLSFQVIRTETRSAADGLLVGVRELDELHVLHYVSKIVFPYDFFEEGIDLRSLQRAAQAAGRAPNDSSDYAGLSAAEWRSFEAYNLARSTGFDPGTSGSPFLVLTLLYEYGYRLPAESLPFRLSENETESIIVLDPPELLDIRIEDPRRDRYPYPDASVSAENWRRISDFVLGRAESSAFDEDLAEVQQAALEEATQFFLSSARAAGLENPRIVPAR